MKRVAVFWLVGEELFLFPTPLEQAEKADVFYDSPLTHIEQWNSIRKKRPDLPARYEVCPPGRMTYNAGTKTFQLMADKKILENETVLSAIKSGCGLTEDDKVVLTADSHYRS